MSLCFIHSTDGGDTNSTSGLFNPGSQFPGAPITTNPRWPAPYNNSVQLGGINTEGLQRILTPSQEDDLLIIGGAFRPTVATDGGQTSGLLALFGDTTTHHFTCTLLSDGSVRARRGQGHVNILGTSAPGVVAFNAWNYIAAKVRLHDTTGTVDIEVNGQNVLSLTNQDTKNGGTAAVFNAGSWGNAQARDLYICNEQGSINNNFLGDVRVTALFPTGDSTPEEWDLSTGTDSFALLDEVTLNTTDYIESDVDGEITRVTFGDLPDTSHTVKGVQYTAYAAKSDAGARSFRMGIHSDATTANSGDFVLGTGFTSYHFIRELDPDGDVAWTPTSVNALAAQVEVRP